MRQASIRYARPYGWNPRVDRGQHVCAAFVPPGFVLHPGL